MIENVPKNQIIINLPAVVMDNWIIVFNKKII